MDNITEQIHTELKESLEKECIPVLDSTKEVIEINENTKQYFSTLTSAGFNNTLTDQFNKEKNEYFSDIKLEKEKSVIKSRIQEYQTLYPTYKMISFTSLHRVMEKYDLYIGPAKVFNKNIPIENARELEHFMNIDFSKTKPKWINPPLYNTHTIASYSSNSLPGSQQYMIAATSDHFDLSDTTVIGRELTKSISKPKFKYEPTLNVPKFNDPIILAPFLLSSASEFSSLGNIIMFFIVSAWGKEAQAEEIFNQLNN